jgi:hypothetical protein
MSASSRSGPRARLLAALIAASLPLGAPAPAAASTAVAAASAPQFGLWAFAATTGKLSAGDAASARKATQTKAKGLLDADNPDGAAELLAEEADKKADPVLYIDAAEAYKAAGIKNKSRVDLENGIENARVGLDILYFLQDPRADGEWQPVAGGDVSSEISRGEKAVEGCEAAIEDLSKKSDEPAPVVEDKQRKKAPRDGRGLIATGAVFTVVGVAGLAMIGGGLGTGISAQKHVDGLNPSDPNYAADVEADDKKGALGNTLVYAGIPVAVVGLATGIALLAVGVKKRKKYRAENGGGDETSRVQVLPVTGRGYGGLVLSGRF